MFNLILFMFHVSCFMFQLPNIVKLNVGGTQYVTKLSTLCKYPNSMLATMFSGKYPIAKDDSDNYFLDRNGKYFGYILDYLRCGTIPPGDVALAVYREAEYYIISSLQDALKDTPEVVRVLVKEKHLDQFPGYHAFRQEVIQLAINNAIATKSGDVMLFVSHSVTKRPHKNCISEMAPLKFGPWDAQVDEEVFMRTLCSDLLESGYVLKPFKIIYKGQMVGGYAIGGLSGGEEKDLFWRAVDVCCRPEGGLPADRPRYVMGVGYSLDLIVCVALGADMFDCVFPTRTGRFGCALVPTGSVYLPHAQYRDDERPIDADCACAACRTHSRAYLHSICGSGAFASLVSLHNVAYMLQLTAGIRAAVLEDRFPAFCRAFFARQYADKSEHPRWAVEALASVGIVI